MKKKLVFMALMLALFISILVFSEKPGPVTVSFMKTISKLLLC